MSNKQNDQFNEAEQETKQEQEYMDKETEIKLANKFVEWHNDFFESHKCKPNRQTVSEWWLYEIKILLAKF